jgi:hypothetical protein
MKLDNRALTYSIIIMCICGCKTQPYGKAAVGLSGMVYDFDNKPVSQYIVRLGRRNPVSTDITGRFFFSKVKPGVYSIRGGKLDYEIYEGEITINDRRQIVYFRVANRGQLIDLADKALTYGRIDEAETYIRRAESIEGEATTEQLFYSAIISFRKKKYGDAIKKLESAVKNGARDEYVLRFLDKLTARYVADENLEQ